ncbi:hypothetical protein Cgig2_022825 [Carnegiea gigantea]|uniref:Reverse transcriptase zinc-binding domain-containing protein n=1 Tax=Carnegiea gigantea TaxID=171969 RepID=A0A9Q1KQP3_9CARY|nr:hypothetical protein Cgig2_022825 [Carnegiea gigantea]
MVIYNQTQILLTVSWIPRPLTFKVITPKPTGDVNLQVCNLIEGEAGSWRVEHVRELFLPYDADIILAIPLCNSWPDDKLIRHYTANAYHLIMEGKRADEGRLTYDDSKYWKAMWDLEVPPQVKVYAWRVCRNLLPSPCNLAKRIPSIDIKCAICGAQEELDLHIFLECPFAEKMWEASELRVGAMATMNHVELSYFVATLYECWAARNAFIFKERETNPGVVYQGACVLVQSFSEAKECIPSTVGPHPHRWRPASSGLLKLKFDGGMVGEAGRGGASSCILMMGILY